MQLPRLVCACFSSEQREWSQRRLVPDLVVAMSRVARQASGDHFNVGCRAASTSLGRLMTVV